MSIRYDLSICLSVCLALASAMFLILAPAQAAAGREGVSPIQATKIEIQRDMDGFVSAGGVYQASGFADFPNDDTPFQPWQKLDSSRLKGDEVVVSSQGHRIWKYFYCARNGNVYLELAMVGREGNRYPFAWLSCDLHCSQGGRCGEASPLFIDITGDSIPDIRFASIEDLIKVKSSFFRNTRVIFKDDMVPRWLKRILGPNFRNISTVGPGASIDVSRDHPLGVSEAGGGQAH